MDLLFLERLTHIQWLNNLRKLKEVKGLMHITKAGAPTPYKLEVTVGTGANKKKIAYLLGDNRDIEILEEEYKYILNDLTKRGHG